MLQPTSDAAPSSFELVRRYFHQAADRLGLADDLRELLLGSYREVQVSLPLRLSDARIHTFRGYRVQHNGARGPFRGRMRFHAGRPRPFRAARLADDVEEAIVSIPLAARRRDRLRPCASSRRMAGRLTRPVRASDRQGAMTRAITCALVLTSGGGVARRPEHLVDAVHELTRQALQLLRRQLAWVDSRSRSSRRRTGSRRSPSSTSSARRARGIRRGRPGGGSASPALERPARACCAGCGSCGRCGSVPSASLSGSETCTSR